MFCHLSYGLAPPLHLLPSPPEEALRAGLERAVSRSLSAQPLALLVIALVDDLKKVFRALLVRNETLFAEDAVP